MTTIILDGKVRAGWCSAIANIAQPTVAELNAGTNVTGVITPTGLSITPSTNAVSAAGNLGSKKMVERAGKVKQAINVTYHHDDTADSGFTLWTYQQAGYLVVRRGIDKDTAWTAGQKVEVYKVECGEREEVAPGDDVTWDATVPMFAQDWETRAVVA